MDVHLATRSSLLLELLAIQYTWLIIPCIHRFKILFPFFFAIGVSLALISTYNSKDWFIAEIKGMDG